MPGALDQIRIASPCPIPWSRMRGNYRVRYCAQCKLHVYNIASLTHEEGVELIRRKEGRFCARVFYRRDGTVMTKDCPEGAALVRRSRWRAIAALAVMALTAGAAVLLALDGRTLAGRSFRGIVTGEAAGPEAPPKNVYVATGVVPPMYFSDK